MESNDAKKRKTHLKSSFIAHNCDVDSFHDTKQSNSVTNYTAKEKDTASSTTKKKRLETDIMENSIGKSDRPTCQYFIPHKKRCCNISCIKGKDYCVEHSYILKDSSVRKRIPCPLDDKHSCYEDQLEKHLKRCNARHELRPKYYHENINSGKLDGKQVSRKKLTIQQFPKEDVFSIIDKCKALYIEYEQELNKEERLGHHCFNSAKEDPKNGAPALKHINQQASLIGHMDKLGLLKNGNCFLEFGAGKGGLTHWVKQSLNEEEHISQFILVDRGSVRYKMDIHNKDEDGSTSIFERLKIDIQHLCLDDVSILNHDRPIVTIGKHLCGNATDFMLRCIVNTLHESTDHKRFIHGVNLATCCHHRCDWKSYVGKDFILKSGLTPEQFNIMCNISSWGCCGIKAVDNPDYNHPYYGTLKPQEREVIGFHVKLLLDLGRKKYLQENGFDTVELVHFIDKECTPENVCLLAVKNLESVDNNTPNNKEN